MSGYWISNASRPTDNVPVAGNLTSEPLDWAGDLVDLRKTDNALGPGSMSKFRLDLTASANADLPGNLA